MLVEVVNGAFVTGSAAYCATVSPPIPVASADTVVFVVESLLVTLPVVPVWVDELPVAAAVDVVGAAGGVVGGGGGEVQVERVHHGL